MKAIKFNVENNSAIVQALAQANGKASTHTFTEFNTLANSFNAAARGMPKMGGAKHEKGIKIIVTSGESVKSAYKYSRIGTRVTFEKRASGWFIIDIQSVAIYSTPDRDRYILTPANDARALEYLKSQYSVSA